MAIERIVSGGQTGVDRAALDVAIVRGLPHGGWCPAGRLAEDGPLPLHYELVETPTADYAQRTEWNVRDSDGTLVITPGEPTGGTGLTVKLARRATRPVLVVRTDRPDALGHAPREFVNWLRKHNVRILNVAGPRRSQWPRAYRATLDLLNRLLDEAASPTITNDSPLTDENR